MELVIRRIPWKKGDHTPIYIAPIGDMQWSGLRGPTAQDTLKRHVDRCLELNALFLGMGDYTDFMSPSNRQRYRAAAFYDTATDSIDDLAMNMIHEIYDKFFRETKGRWLGMLEGHHLHELKTGETTDQRLCQLLDAQFLGSSAYIQLQLRVSTSHFPVTVWCHHGVGSGRTAGAGLNRLKEMAAQFEGADVYLMGHTTKLSFDRIAKPFPNWAYKGGPRLIHRDATLLVTGGFAAAYKQGAMQGRVPRGGYAEQKMLGPSPLAAPIVRITPYTRYYRRPDGRQERIWEPEIVVIA